MTKPRHRAVSIVDTLADVVRGPMCEATWRSRDSRLVVDESTPYRQHRCGHRGAHIIHECRYCGAHS